MNINCWNPYIRKAMYSVIPKDVTIKNRIIFDYELLYVKHGSFKLFYDDKEYLCQSGDVLFIRPGITHRLECTLSDVVQPHIHFDLIYDELSQEIEICFRDYCELTEKEKGLIRKDLFPNYDSNSPFLQIPDFKKFTNLFFELIDLYEKSNNGFELLCKARMLELLQVLTENQKEVISEKPSVISEIKQFIDANYEQKISLEMLERQFHYSRFHIEKEFKKITGEPVMKYYNSLRLSAARQILKNCSVTETAEKLGYSSVYAFSRAFKNEYGVSPRNDQIDCK